MGAPDLPIDMLPPKRRNILGREQQSARSLHFAQVDPFDVGIVIGPGAIGQRRSVLLYIPGIRDVLHLVLEAIQISDDLAQESTPDFVVYHLSG